MNKMLKHALSIVLALSLSANAYAADAEDVPSIGNSASAPNASAPSYELASEDLSVEFISTVYSGKPQQPAVTVSVNGAALSENADYTVSYPEDCVNTGVKTVVVNGIGSYTGTLAFTYEITPLDCSAANTELIVDIEKCVYSGLALTPKVTVSAGDLTLTENVDYTLTFSNNVNVTATERATCELSFIGNFTGRRIVFFDIAKAPSYDVSAELKVKPGEEFVFDLSGIKPPDAVFGAPKYNANDFAGGGTPKIAFNELKFALSEYSRGAVIYIPVTGFKNYSDYELIFYVTPTDKEVPQLTLNPIVKAYDGKPISENALAENGSFAEMNGEKIAGEWYFWDRLPSEPCENRPMAVTFYPDNEELEPVDGIVAVTISRLELSGFSVTPAEEAVRLGITARLTVRGIPKDANGTVVITCAASGEEDFSITEVPGSDQTVREFEVQFPLISKLYIFTAEFGGDHIYAPCTAECTVKVGNPKLPEEEQPDTVTSAEELAAMIENAKTGGIIAAEGVRSVSASLVRAAAEKGLILDIRLNDNYTWTVDTAKLTNRSVLDLNITSAVIPYVLLEQLGGERGSSFTVPAKNLGDGAKITVKTTASKGFANLYLYNTDGEMEFVSCAAVDTDGYAALKLSQAGKYAVILDKTTRLPGDCNSDARITSADALSILTVLATGQTGGLQNGDFNNDGRITSKDALDILIELASNPFNNA